jgi:hypothetical protein
VPPTGFSLRIDGAAIFHVTGYVPAQDPSDPIIKGTPNRTDLLLVSGNPNEFDPGTSGAVWVASQSVVDAMQVAAFNDNWSRDIDQPMEQYLSWASTQVGSPVRLIAVF